MQNERRRYFRVTDLVGISYRFLTENESELAAQAQPASLKHLLGQIEDQINVVLQSLRYREPDIHQVLELFNQKINLAFGHGLADRDQELGQSMRACRVNISASGIGFPSPEPAHLNQHIELDLTLFPSNIRLHLIAAVIACEEFEAPEDDNRYLLRADFVNISDADQELLVQHVIKRQATQLKELREQGRHE
jgi:c-di-GMP-binding flagellar brake protein YcgR